METATKHQRITEVLQDYWLSKCVKDIIPSDGEIDPQDLGELWEHCFLVQKIDADKFQYLHMGKEIIEAYGDDLTGHEICERLVGKLHEPLANEFSEVVATRRPLLKESSFINAKQMDVRYRTILLPLRRNSAAVEYILGGMKWKAF
jgi:hypothetical protein